MCYRPAYHPCTQWTRNCFFNTCVMQREVSGEGGSTRAYTFCAAQIEDLKSYFDHEEVSQEMSGDSPENFTDGDSPVMLIGDRTSPRSRQEFLDLLPPKHIADRLVMRYFNAHSASQRTQDTLRCPHLPSWSQTRVLTAKFDRRRPQANIRQISMRDPKPLCTNLETPDEVRIWNQDVRC